MNNNLNDDTVQGGLNPLQALARLSNVIITIDHVLRDPYAVPDASLKRRIVYARNTLREALLLWQGDALERLAKSHERGGFYVYSMTDAEKHAFTRRIRPALDFTAEELRAIDHPATRHLVPLIAQMAQESVVYAMENRASIIMAIKFMIPGEFYAPIHHAVMALPAENTAWALTDPAAASG